MYRRRLLELGGLALAGLTAGCSGGDGGDEPAEAAVTAPTSTSTRTATTTPTPTETATPTPSVPIHERGTTFTVGEGSEELRYTFEAFYRAEKLGHSINAETPDGTFLIAVLTLENPQTTTTSFPVNDVVARADGTIGMIERDGTQAIESDDRIDVPPIGFSSVAAGSSRQGAVAYDLPMGKKYWIEVTPPGEDDVEPHVVPIGAIGDVETLEHAAIG